ncbi:MAG: lysophospholipid acyltransferase family protein [Microlunatus sp.]
MADAEIIQLGSSGKAGRGSGTTPSAAARGLAPGKRSSAGRTAGGRSAGGSRSGTPGPAVVAEPIEDLVEEPVESVEDPIEVPENLGDESFEDLVEELADEQAEELPHEAATEPPDSGGALSELVMLLRTALAQLQNLPVEQLKDLSRDPLKTVLQLAATLGVDWQESVDDIVEYARSRLSGQYAIDEFGFDPEFTTKVFLPIMRPLAQHWFRVEVRGIENVPAAGSALLVSNHAGTLPIDGLVLHSVIYDEIGRHVRMLGADLVFKTPYSHDFARRTGTTLACQEDAERLLASDQLVAVFPEGFKGLGKPYADRYKLQRFGRGGFVSAAVRAQVPLVPISIVGSEEIYPLIASAPTLARALGAPYFPITPLFPWFGLLGLVPLPSKWIIQFGEAITTDELPPGAADDPMVVFNVTDQVRETIQQSLYSMLMQRRSAFF